MRPSATWAASRSSRRAAPCRRGLSPTKCPSVARQAPLPLFHSVVKQGVLRFIAQDSVGVWWVDTGMLVRICWHLLEQGNWKGEVGTLMLVMTVGKETAHMGVSPSPSCFPAQASGEVMSRSGHVRSSAGGRSKVRESGVLCVCVCRRRRSTLAARTSGQRTMLGCTAARSPSSRSLHHCRLHSAELEASCHLHSWQISTAARPTPGAAIVTEQRRIWLVQETSKGLVLQPPVPSSLVWDGCQSVQQTRFAAMLVRPVSC